MRSRARPTLGTRTEAMIMGGDPFGSWLGAQEGGVSFAPQTEAAETEEAMLTPGGFSGRRGPGAGGVSFGRPSQAAMTDFGISSGYSPEQALGLGGLSNSRTRRGGTFLRALDGSY